jgi:sterol desaturase/sphingolipid hydroxylase (fatty acid hydroxylase superfamily)
MAANIAGTKNGHFFRILPDYIDQKKKPGFSPIPVPTFGGWLWVFIQMKHIWASPNLVWSVIALLMYFLFPYDLSPMGSAHTAPLSFAFFRERLPLWFIVVFGYNAFFHITLYFLNWSERPFIPNRKYNWNKVMHNVFWSASGLVIWTGFDNVFAYLWATGRLPYLSDATAFSTVSGFIRFVAGLVLVPAWRDSHFYFAHRILHFKPLFTQVHSLHHRNTDIEPFSGICMHPVEHLFYYACILPSVVFLASPFHFLWNGVHLLLSPGASHSGWEDHWQADGFHYMHHRYFECNYAGSSSAFLDYTFDTFVPNFKEKSGKVEARDDAKSTLGVPTTEFVGYLLASALCVGVWAYVANEVASGAWQVSTTTALILSFVCGFGPVLIACAMTIYQSGVGALLEPFQKKPLSQSFLHILVGSIFSSFPVSVASYLALV